MKNFIKIIFGLILLVLLLAGAAVIALFTIDPNDYKTQIASATKQATNRDLTIAGDMSVVYYPVLGFKAAGLTMGNTPDFTEKDFIKAGEVQAGVKILPLLSRKIEITTVRLVEPQITVIKRADGSNNLAMPERGAAQKAETRNLDITIEGIEVSKARVTYIDKAAGKTTIIDPLNLKIPTYANGRDIDITMDMTMPATGSAKAMKVDLETTVKPDLKNNVHTFRNLKVNADFGGAKATATAGVVADLKAESIRITNLETGWQGTDLKGNATVKGFKNPDVSFDLSSPKVDLDALFPSDPKAKGDRNKTLLPLDLLRSLTMDGKVSIGTLKTAGLTMSNIKFNVDADSGLIKINPLTLNMYDGTLTSDVQINARGNPSYKLSGGLKGLEVGKLLVAKMGQDYVTGVSDVNFNLNAQGNTMNALYGSAGGTIKFDFGKGYINKWQLSRLMNQAIAYFDKGELDNNASDKIYFTSLDATFNGSGGVFRNDDLVLIGPKSHALGAGTVDLGRERVDYVVKVGGGDNPEKFGKKKHLPVRMSGPFSKPSYSIDMQSLVQDLAGEKIEEKKQEVMDKLFEKLDKKVNKGQPAPADGAATDGAAAGAPKGAAEGAESAPASEKPEDPLKSLLRGALGGR